MKPMQKGEAVACLKAIYNLFPASAVTFERTNSLKGITKFVSMAKSVDQIRNLLEAIAKEHCLEVKEENGYVIIFTP